MKNKLTLASAILAATTLAVSHANAGLNSNNIYDGEVFLCFHASGGTGSADDLEIPLGPYNDLLTSINISSDLSTVYGSSWFSNTNLRWSIIGADQNDSGNYGGPEAPNDTAAFDTLFLSSPTTAMQPLTGAEQDTPAGAIENNYALITSANATNTTNGAYTLNGGTGPTAAYSNNPLTDIEADFSSFGTQTADFGSSGHDSTVLYELEPSDSGDPSFTLGTYTLAGTGEFSVAAVPEPSTWASVALGALALVGLRRRPLA